MNEPKTAGQFVVCLSNRGYRVSLQVRKLYRTVPDEDAERHGLYRVIDESGEDYLFPQSLFAALSIPQEIGAQLAS